LQVQLFRKVIDVKVIVEPVFQQNTVTVKYYRVGLMLLRIGVRLFYVAGGPSTPYDPESDAGGSLSSWQGHPSR
jgi:hypothetical protein